MTFGKTFGFNEQLQIGNDAEQRFIKGYAGLPLVKHSARAYDFDRADGKRIELKSDTYVGSKNFFFERWSNIDKQKPGSVWQSIDKADIFIYCFVNEGVYYEFADMPLLLSSLESICQSLPLIRIPNRGYAGGGYKVPRELLLGCACTFQYLRPLEEK